MASDRCQVEFAGVRGDELLEDAARLKVGRERVVQFVRPLMNRAQAEQRVAELLLPIGVGAVEPGCTLERLDVFPIGVAGSRTRGSGRSESSLGFAAIEPGSCCEFASPGSCSTIQRQLRTSSADAAAASSSLLLFRGRSSTSQR